MFTLENYQKAFSRFVLNGDASALRPMIAEGQSADQLSIYRNNVIISLGEALAKTFPATFALVGETFFQYAAKGFIAKHPPTQPVLAWYGEKFPEFLDSLEGIRKHPYLPDVARLEWARNRANTAPDASAALSPGAFGKLAGEGDVSSVALAPSVSLLRSAYPIAEIREFALGKRKDPPAVKAGEPRFLIVYRKGSVVHMETLSEAVFLFLTGLQAGESLEGEAFEEEDLALQGTFVAELGRLVAGGIFTQSSSKGGQENE